MRAEGQAVSLAQLCRWFGVPRSTFYYRPAMGTARPPVIDEAVRSRSGPSSTRSQSLACG